MLFHNAHNLKRFRKVLLLVGVYALHLVFLQALMVGSGNEDGKVTKPLFVQNFKKSIPGKPHHPAVTYFTMLVKSGSAQVKAINQAPNVAAAVTHAVTCFQTQLNSTNLTVTHFLCNSQFKDDVFKLYRLICLFRI